VSLNIKLKAVSLLPVAAGTALVLVTYVTPMATLATTAAGLRAGAGPQAWLLSSMSVGLAAGLLTAGVVGDNVGRRRVYLGGLVALAVGALVCFLAQEPVGFVIGRVVEGLGGAAVLACGLAILANDFPDARGRTHATAVWGTSVGVGISVGALLSAVLGAARWRESYLAVGVIALILLWPSISRIGNSQAANRRRLDVVGLGLFAAAMILLVCALTLGRGGIRVVPVVLGFTGLAALIAFAFAESRVRDALIDPKLLRHNRFRAATVGSLALGSGVTATVSFVPTLAQVGLGSGLWTASVLVVAWSGTSMATAYLSRHIPHPMQGPTPIATSLVIVAVGQALGYGLNSESSPWRLVPSLVVAGVATGLLNALLGREAVASVEADRSAMGSGANNTARYFGAAVGITLFVVIATHVGEDLAAGWNVAILVSAAISLIGAGGVAIAGKSHRIHAVSAPAAVES
jgi:MFS family permease